MNKGMGNKWASILDPSLTAYCENLIAHSDQEGREQPPNQKADCCQKCGEPIEGKS
jgi:hypothetical protein